MATKYATQDSAVDRLLDAIQVPDARYEAANRAFKSVCEWLSRPTSTLARYRPDSYLQGSFRLGTTIRPITDDDDYDVDIVTVLALTKQAVAPSTLKQLVGTEIKSYAARYDMQSPADNRRCWTQDYADDAQFHIDTLPAVPDAGRQRALLEASYLDTRWAASAIAITDKRDANYNVINEKWPLSNPRAYAEWFEERMAIALNMRKGAIALRESKKVDDIPTYRARVPLQSAVQVLKFHRDVMFIDEAEDKPISIIITTLAAKSYRNELDLASALRTILRDMDSHIEQRLGADWVANPTNELENFADKWVEHPNRRANFYKWLETAREDFARLDRASSTTEVQGLLEEIFGPEVAKRAVGVGGQATSLRVLHESKLNLVRSALHRRSPPWTVHSEGTVRIVRASKLERGFRPKPLSSDSDPVRKGAELNFYARTNVPGSFEVYWQVVNTGAEAAQNRDLRGGFDTGAVFSGKTFRRETARYHGVHSIECFIVKDDYLAARSGPFLVNVQ
jgi:adenylyl/guanylyl cyclase-like protein with sensor domain/cyclic GMP-AMP synthase DncV-like protein